jgi:CDP-diacylglycerol--serine O-phosphatidyltransferase
MEQESAKVTELHTERPRRPRGIYLLPNLFTTAALFAGFYAVLASMNDQFEKAAIAIFVAMILDGLDGRVARMTNTQTAFGAEYDSLSDMVAFGLAPSLVVYEWSLLHLGKFGWLAAFIYTAGAALRLARFNSQIATADKRYFTGLPSPSAAAVVAAMVWVGFDNQLSGELLAWPALLLTSSIPPCATASRVPGASMTPRRREGAHRPRAGEAAGGRDRGRLPDRQPGRLRGR